MRTAGLWILVILFVVAGVSHLIDPKPFLQIMPPQLPKPEWLVAVSGVAEIFGGIGIAVVRTRPVARWGLAALLVCVFPANVYMAFHHVMPEGLRLPQWLLWLRLCLQPMLIWWVLAVTRKSPRVRIEKA